MADKYIWHVEGNRHGDWHDVDKEEMKVFDEALARGCQTVDLVRKWGRNNERKTEIEIDFTAMTETSATGIVRRLRRIAIQHISTEDPAGREVVWFVDFQQAGWKDCNAGWFDELDQALRDNTETIQLRHSWWTGPKQHFTMYKINLKDMTQTNPDSNTMRRIYRAFIDPPSFPAVATSAFSQSIVDFGVQPELDYARVDDDEAAGVAPDSQAPVVYEAFD